MPHGHAPCRHADCGFTLVELLLSIAIVGVLVAAAIPTFVDYVRRARIVEAVTRLSDHYARMEQYFLDNHRYDDGAGGCGNVPLGPGPGDAFSVECVAAAASYTITARGIAGRGMQAFAFTIDQANARRTIAVPGGWTGSDTCWVVRRDGSCA
jgi:type IV pilus assembly protein PilE